MKLYIAGKITGLVYEDALRKFAEAEAMLTRLGHEPVNPMRENPGIDLDWAEYMKRDIPLLLKCDGIFLLPDWAESRGAVLEHHIARELGMRIFHSACLRNCLDCGEICMAVEIDHLSGFCRECGKGQKPIWA